MRSSEARGTRPSDGAQHQQEEGEGVPMGARARKQKSGGDAAAVRRGSPARALVSRRCSKSICDGFTSALVSITPPRDHMGVEREHSTACACVHGREDASSEALKGIGSWVCISVAEQGWCHHRGTGASLTTWLHALSLRHNHSLGRTEGAASGTRRRASEVCHESERGARKEAGGASPRQTVEFDIFVVLVVRHAGGQ